MNRTGIVTAVVLLSVTITATNSFSSSWETLVLENGMELTLREAHSNPMVACIVTIGAGSSHENAAENGVSHMLEHLLFDGTAKRSRGELTEAQRKVGGYFNAFTRKDYTCFFFVVPSESLEEALEILSDMLLGSILPAEEVEKERKVVVEEMIKDMSSADYMADRYADGILYSGTPYAKPVIGARNVIESIPREDILSYYERHYSTGNMRMLLVGDFDAKKAPELVERSFGAAPVKALRERPQPVSMTRRNEVHTRSLDCDHAYVYIEMAAPPMDSKDYYPFTLLCRLLNRPSSILMDGLKADKELGIVSADLTYDNKRSFSDVTLKIKARSTDVEAIVSRSLALLADVASIRLTRGELEGARVSMLADEIYLEEQYHYYGMFKAGELALAGGRFLAGKLGEMEKVGEKDVRRVARKYFGDFSYTVAAIVPEEEKKSAPSAGSRSRYETWEEPNGIRAAYKYNEDSRVFAVHMLFENRLLCEPEGKKGITELVSRMLEKGAGDLDEKALDRALAAIGAELEVTDNPYIPYDDYRTRENYSFIRFQTIDEFYERGLELLAKIAFEPRLEEGGLEEARSELEAAVSARDRNPVKIARKLLFSTLFEGHPFGFDVMGEKEDIESISIDEVRYYHRRYFSPSNLILTIAGNIPPGKVRESVGRFFGGLPPARTPCSAPVPAPVAGIEEVSAGLDAPQAAICLGNLVEKPGPEELPALTVANGILSRRLAEELREKRGLAYSVGSSIYVGADYAYLVVSMGTSPEKLDDAGHGIVEVMENFAGTITEDEVASYKSSSRGRMLMRRLSRINQAYYMGLDMLRGFGFAYDDEFTAALKDVTFDRVVEAARKYIPVGDFVVARVGPKE